MEEKNNRGRQGSKWQAYRRAYLDMLTANQDLMSDTEELLATLKEVLGSPDSGIGVMLLSSLPEQFATMLVVELLDLAKLTHGHIDLTRSQILRIPKDDLEEPLMRCIFQTMQRRDEEEVRRMLELLSFLDSESLKSFATWATQQSDDEIAEAGRDFV